MAHSHQSTSIQRFPTSVTFQPSQLSEATRIALSQASQMDIENPTTPRQPTHPVPPNAPARVREQDIPPPPTLPMLSRSVKRYVPYGVDLETGDIKVAVIGIPERDEMGNPRTRESWIRALKRCTPEANQGIWETFDLERYVDDRGIFDELQFMADNRL